MPSFSPTEIVTYLTSAQNFDNGLSAGDRRKLPTTLRDDVNADLADLAAKEVAVAPAEGGRTGASGTRRAALDQLRREHQGGYRFIQGLDEATITTAQRRQVYESYGWESSEIGDFTDDRIIALARLAPTVTAVETGNVLWLYPAARLGRIAAQLAIVDAQANTASGGDRQSATLARDAAEELAATTLLRVRFFYCSATRDADQTPLLVMIGYQPRRGPGEAGGGPTTPPPGQATVTVGQDSGGNWSANFAVPNGTPTGWKVESLAPGASDWSLLAENHPSASFDLGPLTSGAWQVRVTALGEGGAGPVSEPFAFTA